jgi:predicted GTPase
MVSFDPIRAEGATALAESLESPQSHETLFAIEEFLALEETKDLLRFSTAGSVDDGKSTLIGRLLYDSRNVYEDQVRAVTGSITLRVRGNPPSTSRNSPMVFAQSVNRESPST